MRASVRSRLRRRVISCPAAKQMRCVTPSIATVSPSWTSSATASFIVVTLLLIGRPPIFRTPEHAELVALGVEHHRPEAAVLLDVPEHRRAERAHALDLLRHRRRRAQGEGQPGLHPLAL